MHIANRDVAFAAVSTAPLDKLLPFQKRMGWGFVWVSSGSTDFNRDFHVTFTQDELDNEEVTYNYRDGISFSSTEVPGSASS